jgi:hypothetical protein
MSFPFAKPTSMTSPNGGHRRPGDLTTDLRVLVIATTSVIVATAGGVAGIDHFSQQKLPAAFCSKQRAVRLASR